LAIANARVLSLEAELDASRKAFDAATAAKANAEKSTKSALAKAKKAEKALSDANKERLQREQAVTDRLNKIFASTEGTYYAFPFFYWVAHSLCLLMCAFSFCLCFLCCAEHTGVSSSSVQPDDDSLMTAVNLLEANWISIQEIFELVSRVLTDTSQMYL
jgi:hypothetical protein